jgi:hypothetical protein
LGIFLINSIRLVDGRPYMNPFIIVLRSKIMAATMWGQGKNAWQAEIDAHVELADFWRFNCKFAEGRCLDTIEMELIHPSIIASL